jgi:hypothetical protein
MGSGSSRLAGPIAFTEAQLRIRSSDGRVDHVGPGGVVERAFRQHCPMIRSRAPAISFAVVSLILSAFL